jgi:hypothetical protein
LRCRAAIAAKAGECLTARLGHLDYEVFGLILLDKRHRVIECADLFRGTIDGASVRPREAAKLALQKSAAACIACHNHPLGGFVFVTTEDNLLKYSLSEFNCRLNDDGDSFRRANDWNEASERIPHRVQEALRTKQVRFPAAQ